MTIDIDLFTQLPEASEIVGMVIHDQRPPDMGVDVFVVCKRAIYRVNQTTVPTSIEMVLEVKGIDRNPA